MNKVWICTGIFLLLAASLYSFNPKEYNLYKSLSVKSSNALIEIIEERGFKVQNDTDIKTVCSALKRIGELRLTNVRQKVTSLVETVSPEVNANIEKTKFRKNIYYMGIIVMGQIGGKEEAERLALYISSTKYRIAKIYLIQALGKLPYPISLEVLNEQTQFINATERTLALYLLDALKLQKSKSSLMFIRNMQMNGNFTDKKIVKVFDDVVIYLEENGEETE